MENRRIRPRCNFEEQFMKRRDKEMRHAETWGNTVKYYDRMDKVTHKFDDWTSPRYYETNNGMMEKRRKDREKQELLEKRRENLRKLMSEDERTYEIELMVKNRDKFSINSKPVELLKMVNDEIKCDEEEKRRLKAEEGLYKAWRNSNTVLRECQRQQTSKDLKLSWLDQQIEKRMAREKEAELMKKSLKEKELYIKEQRAKEQELEKEMSVRKLELKEYLEQQIAGIKQRDEAAKELKRQEDDSIVKKLELLKLEDKWAEEQKRRSDCEVALYNLKEHRRKLELKSKNIEEQLEKERKFIADLQNAELIDKIADQNKKLELKHSMEQFTTLLKDLKELEEKRKPHLLFTFESEAKGIYKQFNEVWMKEQEMRESLMKDVLAEIKQQIDTNAEQSKEKQKQIIKEKEEMLLNLEKYQQDMKQLKETEELKKEVLKKDLDEQIKENRRNKKRLENLERKKHDDELEKIRNEEDRLKREIAKLQKGKALQTYGRRRFFY